MRFGISEISWMLPKILRIRREDAEPRLVLRARASIALVAMIFPALSVHRRTPVASGSRRWVPSKYYFDGCPVAGKQKWERFSRLLLPNAFDPCAVRVLSRGGQEKLRTHVAVRRSRYFVDGADIVIRQRLKRGNRKGAAPKSRPSSIEV